MVQNPFVIDISKALERLSDNERLKFYQEVNNCIEDSSWLRENRINPVNPNRDMVKRVLYNQLYNQ